MISEFYLKLIYVQVNNIKIKHIEVEHPIQDSTHDMTQLELSISISSTALDFRFLDFFRTG